MGNYDSSWDEDNDELSDKKYKEWKKREWLDWLKINLTFPFKVRRMEDLDSSHIFGFSDHPFAVGEIMSVINLEDEDEMRGVIAKVRKRKKIGHVPLADVKVISKEDQNFWPAREYVVWFANQS